MQDRLSRTRHPGRRLALVIAAMLATPAWAVPPDPTSPPSEGGAQVSWGYPEELPFSEDLASGLKVPAGFQINVFAKDLGHARMLLPLDNGAVLLSRADTNDVVRLLDADGDGKAEQVTSVATGLLRVHGMARDGARVYLVGEHEVWGADLGADGMLSKPEVIVSDLPVGAQHRYRTIGIGKDGWLYVSIGSSCNDCVETDPEHATMLRMRPDGSQRSVFARGLRNTIGFGWHPKTGELWGLDHGTDWRGDELPPEELNRIVQDGHYGWPTCFGRSEIDQTRDDPAGTTKAEFCAGSKPSLGEISAHSAPIWMTFYDGRMFPAAYRGDAFAAMRGSFNRRQPREPRIVRLRFADGQPRAGEAGVAEDFVTGFLTQGGKAWFGRLAGVATASDGALLFTDDMNGVVYRVSTARGGQGAAAAPGGEPPAQTTALERVAHLPGFDAPESVLHDAEQDVYFVSNVGGKSGAKDGNGFISKLTPDGRIVNARFIAGGADGVQLNAPKGMAIAGPLLWVSDIDHVRAFDRVTGKPVRSVAVRGAKFLNDVVAAPDGSVYVSDSGLSFDAAGTPSHTGPDRIVRIAANGKANVALESAALMGPNGLWWDASRNGMVIAQMFGKDLLTWTPGADAATPMVSGVGRFDGVAMAGNGEMLVSSSHDSVIYALRAGKLTPLLARPPHPADISIDARRNRLLVPSLAGNWVEIWQLPAP